MNFLQTVAPRRRGSRALAWGLILATTAAGPVGAIASPRAGAGEPRDAAPATDCAGARTASAPPGPGTGRWPVRGVALGAPVTACRPAAHIYRDARGGAATILGQCSFGTPRDTVQVTVGADGRSVVRVVRTEYLGFDGLPGAEVVAQAEKHYGLPSVVDPQGNYAVYGDAFVRSHQAGPARLQRSECGRGLYIHSQPCGDGTFGIEDCRGLGSHFVRFELVDNARLRQAILAGARHASEVDRQSLGRLRF